MRLSSNNKYYSFLTLLLSVLRVSGCGGTLGGDAGELTSPDYPSPYPHQRECVWHIEVRPGSSVQLTITDFDVEKHATCNYDVLEVNLLLGHDLNLSRKLIRSQ